ncbi:hypothetical protein H6G45_04525 [Synechocystis sp. FACHB-383]|uniref:GapS4b family protein n=1 Tax=Synechocystis sp. FACHB-383 TaxID=2692864 RepID=UPI0016876849|nr:hypothetical protein [Synechocystis sp. FACHB-383]MBD2652773.1 hypothetical protein [Synechocystis sp. FACHB-383]
MNKEPEDIDQILPFGELLRGFMEQSFVGNGDLKNILRNRGIFTNNTEKHYTIPILSSTILSPSEFDYLRECQNSKEDNPKIITQTIEWKSKETLFDSAPENLNINSILDLEFSNYKVVGSPNFVAIEGNPNYIKMDFLVEREDMSKNWSTNKNVFPGSLELKKMEDEDEIKLIVTHTANETKYVASKVSNSLVRHFKDKGHIDQSKKIEKILFSRFSNSGRIIYLLSLTESSISTILDFVDIVDIEFSPDTNNPLPKGIDWMQQKINDLKLNGNALHQTFFFSDKSYHEFLSLYQVDSKFKFDVKGFTGQCVISVGFPDYGKTKNLNAEMEVNIKSMSFSIPPKGVNKSEIKQILLKEIEDQKIKNFKQYGLI